MSPALAGSGRGAPVSGETNDGWEAFSAELSLVYEIPLPGNGDRRGWRRVRIGGLRHRG
jgi:hypothetical protein